MEIANVQPIAIGYGPDPIRLGAVIDAPGSVDRKNETVVRLFFSKQNREQRPAIER